MNAIFRMVPAVVCITVLSLLVSFHKAEATTIYSTFGEPGDTYQLTQGWGLGRGSSLAQSFTTNATYRLDEMNLAAFAFLGPSPIQVSLVAGDLANGVTLESFDIAIPTSPWEPQIYQAHSILHPLLEAGTNYWFNVTADDRILSIVGLNFNNQQLLGDIYYCRENEWDSIYGTLMAVSVNGTPVPEPSTLLLLCAGLFGVVIVRRKYLG